MKAKIITRISICAKKADIFMYLADPKFHYLWNPQLKSISTYEILQEGSIYKSKSMVMGIEIASKNIITKFTPDKEIEFQNKTGAVQYRVNFRLAQRGSKVAVRCRAEIATRSRAFAFTTPVLRKIAQRELQTDLKALKLAAEHTLRYEAKDRKIKG